MKFLGTRAFSPLIVIVLVVACATFLFPNQQLLAAPISGLFNTGVNDSGVAQIAGYTDTHYTLNGVVNAARVIAPNGLWALPPVPTKSAWIGPAITGNNSPPGIYIYRLNFDLTGLDPLTALITGKWASDNESAIFLNGLNTGNFRPSLGWGALGMFTISSGFLPGMNELEFVVANGVITNNPHGLLVADLQGTAAVPIPAAAWLLGSGLIGLVGIRRRFRH